MAASNSGTDRKALVDKFGRRVDYIRLSVTDRCDFRCVYCMTEEMTFLPRKEILSLEELFLIAKAFVDLAEMIHIDQHQRTGGVVAPRQ